MISVLWFHCLANNGCVVPLNGMQGVLSVLCYCRCLGVTFMVRISMVSQPSLQSSSGLTDIHFATVTGDPVNYHGVLSLGSLSFTLDSIVRSVRPGLKTTLRLWQLHTHLMSSLTPDM